MNNDDDAWGDLFAKAADVEVGTTTLHKNDDPSPSASEAAGARSTAAHSKTSKRQRTNDDNTYDEKSKKQRKKKKLKKEKNKISSGRTYVRRNNDINDVYETMLNGRMMTNVVQSRNSKYPQLLQGWILVGKSMTVSKCTGWKPKGDDDDDDGHDKKLSDEVKTTVKQNSHNHHDNTIDNQSLQRRRRHRYYCRSCGESAMYHSIDISSSSSLSSDGNTKNDNDSWIIHSTFCNIRNIRCCAKRIIQLIGNIENNDHGDKINSNNRNQSNTPTTTDDNNSDLVLRFTMEAMRKENQKLLSITKQYQSMQHSNARSDELQLLESKVSHVSQCCMTLLSAITGVTTNYNGTTDDQRAQKKKKRKKSKSSNSSYKNQLLKLYFEPAIRVIIACDAVYYRCYYLQLTRVLHPFRIRSPKHSECDSYCYLPHPQIYFGLDGFTSDYYQSYCVAHKFRSTLSKNDATAHDSIGDRHPLMAILQDVCQEAEEEDWQKIPLEEDVSKTYKTNSIDHALEAIHRYRFLETLTLFYDTGWSTSSRAKRLFMESLTENTAERYLQSKKHDLDPETIFYQHHETPAPKILMEWRDSCRDFMCNLYAYATTPTTIVRRIYQIIHKSHGSQGKKPRIVEVGAGTGYVARLFQNAGFHVDASDICPTSSTANEYHGSTPSFTNIISSPKQSMFENCTDATLLLCYPPPQSSMMARDSLQAYLKAGGKRVIHIGEFKGLTGNAAFEKLLQRNFVCILRFPCLTWGTDASSVSIWEITSDSNTQHSAGGNSLLLPCSFCDKRESIKRCRLVRSIVYCSEGCCQRGTLRRNEELRFSMFETDISMLDFSNKYHYANLH